MVTQCKCFLMSTQPMVTQCKCFFNEYSTYGHSVQVLVYVEWASRVNFVTIFVDLYQNKLWVICNNLNQFAHLSSVSGQSNDVIKMAAIVLLMYTYKTSHLKQ